MNQEPRKIKKAGVTKVTSGEMLKKQHNKSNKELELYHRVQIARQAGNINEAVRQIDLLIDYVEKAGKPSFEFQVEKLLLVDPENFAQLIPIYEKQLAYYIKQKKLIEQVDTLVSLTAVCVNSNQLKRAKHYIDLSERVISAISDDQETLERKFPGTGISQVKAKLEQVREAKKFIDKNLDSSS